MNRFSNQPYAMTKYVKWILISNVVIWMVFQTLLGLISEVNINHYFALYPGKVLVDFAIWQPLTYMFLHSSSVTHIVFNMLTLWMIGGELETRWGSRFFVTYYLISGVGAGLLYVIGIGVYSYVTGSQSGLFVPVVGASGAIFGLLVAYGLLFGERTMLFMMMFPMKAKHFVMLLGAIEFFSLLSSGTKGNDVAYLAHLGGLITGYLTLTIHTKMKQKQWSASKKKRGNLKLVVDNDKKNEPKYWN